jgi:hypothetical protein
MEIKIEESFKKARTQTELEESKKEMFVRLHQRECIVRLFDGKKYILPMKLRVVDVVRWGYKPSMEVSKMDAMHDTPNGEGRPPPEAASRAPKQQSGTYSVQYFSQSSGQQPEAEPKEEAQPEEERENPFAPQEAMGEDSIMISDDEEEPAEESAQDEERQEEEGREEEPASERETPEEEEPWPEDEPLEEETPADEEEQPKPAPKRGRRGMVKVDFNEFDEQLRKEPAKGQIASRRLRSPADADEEPEEEKPARKRSRKKARAEESEDKTNLDPRQLRPPAEAGDGEAPLTQVMDDDSELAAKLARIREKAMRVQMEREEEAPAPKKAAGKRAPAKKPAAKAKPAPKKGKKK